MTNKKQQDKENMQIDSQLPKETKEPVEANQKEIGGRTQGLEPTRYGDWEFKGRCIDF